MNSFVYKNESINIEPLEVKHLYMLDLTSEENLLGNFQIILARRYLGKVAKRIKRVNFLFSANCIVATQGEKVIGYVLAEPNNKAGTCWFISQPRILIEPLGYSKCNIKQKLLAKILNISNENNHSWLTTVGVSDNQQLSIIRELGFQPLRIIKYWKLNKSNAPYIKNEHLRKMGPYEWQELNPINSISIWRLEQARMSVNIRAMFDRHWTDIYGKRNKYTGVCIVKRDSSKSVITGLISPASPNHKKSVEIIRGIGWDNRLLECIPTILGSTKYKNDGIVIESSSEDNHINDILTNLGWEEIEERVLLGKSVFGRQRNYESKTNSPKLGTILTNIQQPEFPTP